MSDPSVYRRLAALERAVQLRADRPATTTTAYTPEYYGGTTAGVTTYAAGGQIGVYAQIGPLCWFSVRIEWTAATGTGEARISLPFTAAADAPAIAPAYPVNVAYTGDYLIAQIPVSVAYMNFRSPTTTGAGVLAVEAAGVLSVSGIYAIAL